MANLLVGRDPRLWLSTSWTTRPRRPGEPENAYRFVEKDVFTSAIDDGGFLEWTSFAGHLYGTPCPDPPPGRDILLEIDVEGAKQVRAHLPEALLLFLDAPSEGDQSQRLRTRGDSEDQVQKRVALGPEERATALALGAVTVVNEDIDSTLDAITSIIRERRRELRRTAS